MVGSKRGVPLVQTRFRNHAVADESTAPCPATAKIQRDHAVSPSRNILPSKHMIIITVVYSNMRSEDFIYPSIALLP